MRLPRPYIPLRVRVQVAERQYKKARGIWPGNSVTHARMPFGTMLRIYLRELFGDKAVELHHRPALVNRLKVHIHGSFHRYDPDANDPDYLVYLPADEHDIETRVRGQHGQHSDLALARKRKRIERKKTRKHKHRWPKGRKLRGRGFRQSSI